MKKNNKGFTLAELLIVVAIIAVLVAIAIPIFTAQLEKAREATDASDIRSYYAEISTALITAKPGTATTVVVGGTHSVTIDADLLNDGGDVEVTGWTAHQAQDNWQSGNPVVAGVTVTDNFNGATGITYTFSVDADGDVYCSAITAA